MDLLSLPPAPGPPWLLWPPNNRRMTGGCVRTSDPSTKWPKRTLPACALLSPLTQGLPGSLLCRGYWQVPLTRPKTAFITRGTIMMTSVFIVSPLVCAGVAAISRVKIVSLCCPMRHKVTFQGHRLAGGSVSTMDKNMQAVKDWCTPSSVLRSFLGLSSYYSRFVKTFSCIAVCKRGRHSCGQKNAMQHTLHFIDLKPCACVMGRCRGGGNNQLWERHGGRWWCQGTCGSWCSRQFMDFQDLVTLGLPKHSTSIWDSTGKSKASTWKSTAATVALHIRAPKVPALAPTPALSPQSWRYLRPPGHLRDFIYHFRGNRLENRF